jgi:oligopeptide transport system substrate-binding protein
MSLRTRRSSALLASLLLLAVACTSGPSVTTGPQSQAPRSQAAGTPTPATSPAAGASGTPSGGSVEPSGSAVAQPTGGGTAGGTLRLYLSSEDPPTLDANAAQDSVSIAVLSALGRGLQYWNQDASGAPVDEGGAATFNETDSTPDHLVFNIKPEAVYSDGSPITAEDFVFSVKRLVTPSAGNPYAYIMCPVVGVADLLPDCGQIDEAPSNEAELLDKVGVAAPDPATLTIDLSTPAVYFRSVTAMWVMVPMKEGWTFDTPEGFLSSGPYVMSRWDHNSLIELSPNPNWYGETKALSTIQLNIGGDVDAALASYEQGNLDVVGVPGPQIARVKADPVLSAQVNEAAAQSITYYGFATCQQPPEACPKSDTTNDGKSPSSNVHFRRALTQATDKDTLIQILRAGAGKVANSVVMPGIPGYDDEYNTNPTYPFDIAAAQTEMAQALQDLGIQDNTGPEGEPDGTVDYFDAAGLGRMTLGYNSNAGHLPYVAYLVNSWRQVGISDAQWDLIGTDFSTFLRDRHAGKYDVSRNGWGADFPHAHNQLSDLFRCNGGNNEEQYCNKEGFDNLVDEAAGTADLDAQTALYIQAQRNMMDDAPIIPLFFPITIRLVQPWVQGLIATGLDHQNTGDVFYETISIEPH